MKQPFLLLAMLFVAVANAQQPDTVQAKNNLDDIKITYNKWEQKLNEVPNRISKVSLRDTRLQNPQTMADVLSATGEVFIQKSQGGGGSPMIRGFATNRVLIVVDGVRMNNAIYRSGNIQNVISLDPLALEDAEIIFGPGSLIYGSDAIGGVMDFHTLQPKFSSAKGKTIVKGSAVLRYATANDEKTGHADINIAGNKLSFLSSFSYSDFGDTKMGKHGGDASYLRPEYVERINNKDSIIVNSDPRTQKFTGYHQRNLINKIRFKPNTNWDIQYGFHHSATGNIPRYDRLIEYASGALRFAEWYYGPQIWNMHALQIHHQKTTSVFDEMKFVAGYQNYEESRFDRRRNNNNLREQTETVKALSFNLDLNKQLTSSQQLFYGFEFVHNKVGSVASNTNISNGIVSGVATRYPNGSTWRSYAAYASYKNNVSEKISVLGGLRYNHAQLKAAFDTTYFKFPFTTADIQSGSVTANAGIVYRPIKQWQVNFNFSTGFRMPNIDDVGKVFESAPGTVVVPNPNLRSEYAYNFEIGLLHQSANKHQFYFSAFYTILDDALTRRPFTFNGNDSIMFDGTRSRVEAIQNVAQAKVWGIQTGFELKLTNTLRWETKLNWVQGKETDDVKDIQVPLRHAPPFYGSSALKFRKKGFDAELNGIYNSEITNEDLAPSEQTKTFIYAKDANGKPYSPAWATLNLKLGYSFSKLPLQLNGGIENITDQRYRPYSSGVVSPGRNFIISIRTSF
jgi:hemoglobin/transferrin/lactoferrin receptor protein